jgi:RHH-type rel operon transcriptional repressor/antitoxin RelB
MPMTTISLRLEESDAALIKEYAAMKRMSVSDLIRQTLLDRIAAEVDLHSYKKAVEQYRGGQEIYTHQEVGELLEEVKP